MIWKLLKWLFGSRKPSEPHTADLPPAGMIPPVKDRKAFFDAVRGSFGPLTQKQVNGFNYLLDVWEKLGWKDERWLAYCLATAWHETARTMMPIAEYGRGKGRPYGKPGVYGQPQYGRGYVQLTWDANYAKADKSLGLDGALTKDFDLAMQPNIAAEILYRGMKDGWFTGKRLDHYINDSMSDYKNARRIVNGTDKATAIASYARSFETAVRKL